MDWHEFSNYIIDMGMIQKENKIKDVIKQYKLSTRFKLKKKNYSASISKLQYFPTIKKIVSIYNDYSQIFIYDSSTLNFQKELKVGKLPVITAEEVNYYDKSFLAVSSIDLMISFWNTKDFKLHKVLSTPEIQQCMKYINWNDETQILCTGGNDAVIHIYDLKKYKETAVLTGWNPFLK